MPISKHQNEYVGTEQPSIKMARTAHRDSDDSNGDDEKMRLRSGQNSGETEEMRLRSGHVVGVSGPAAAAPRSAAEARARLLSAHSTTKMPEEHAPRFREGVKAVFDRWTAVQLAVLNSWGGPESEQKAVDAEQEVADWLLSKKSKDALEIEDLLIEILADDFNVTCEDESPREVAKALTDMFEQCAEGNYELICQIEATPLPRETLERCKQVEEDKRWTMNGGGVMDMGDSSSDDGDDEMEEVDADELADKLGGAFNVHDTGNEDFDTSARRRNEPDEDGWCTVPSRR